MLSTSRRAVLGALRGTSIFLSPVIRRSFDIARSVTVPFPFRAQQLALLSTSPVKSATALEHQAQSGQPLTASGKVRKEVPLPSQEKKEGAMQYVLFVSRIFYVHAY